MKIEFVVWQFVRVMVEMESLARPRGRNARATFRARNAATWNDLDKELAALSQANPTTYAKRMMKDTIVVNTKTGAQVVEVSQALGRVINHMAAELRRGTHDDPSQRASLMFEQTELRKLRGTLTQGKAKAEIKPRAKPRGKPPGPTGPRPRRKPAAGPKAKPKDRLPGKTKDRRA